MTQVAALDLPGVEATEHSLRECPPWPSVAGLVAAPRSTGRAEARDRLTASLWLTSLQKPGVFEVGPTENISRFGTQMVTQRFWEPAELVLVSSPPGFCVQGSIVYCKKLPSDDYLLGIRLDVPVEGLGQLAQASSNIGFYQRSRTLSLLERRTSHAFPRRLLHEPG